MGLTRHLTAAEIVEQAVYARRLFSSEVGSITNVVFMVGETFQSDFVSTKVIFAKITRILMLLTYARGPLLLLIIRPINLVDLNFLHRSHLYSGFTY